MPFTLAHPAAAVPLAKRGIPLSAVVIGSLSPDFLYFISFSTSNSFGHTLPGLVLFDLPLSLAVLWIFHKVLKEPLLHLLPDSHRQRLRPVAQGFYFGPPQRWLFLALAILLGAFTHIVWDSFTHENRWIVQNIPLLKATILQTVYGNLKVYKVLQHGSTLVGTGLLLYWYTKWHQSATPQDNELAFSFSGPTKLIIISLIGLGALIFALLYTFLNLPPLTNLSVVKLLVRYLVLAGTGGLLVELIVFCLAWHFIQRVVKSPSKVSAT